MVVSRSLTWRLLFLKAGAQKMGSYTQFVWSFHSCLYRLWCVLFSFLFRKSLSRDSRSFVSPVKTASPCLLCPLTRLEVTFHTFFLALKWGGGRGSIQFDSSQKNKQSINNLFGPQKHHKRPSLHLWRKWRGCAHFAPPCLGWRLCGIVGVILQALFTWWTSFCSAVSSPSASLNPSPPERGLPWILIGGPVQAPGPWGILISGASAIQYALSSVRAGGGTEHIRQTASALEVWKPQNQETKPFKEVGGIYIFYCNDRRELLLE